MLSVHTFVGLLPASLAAILDRFRFLILFQRDSDVFLTIRRKPRSKVHFVFRFQCVPDHPSICAIPINQCFERVEHNIYTNINTRTQKRAFYCLEAFNTRVTLLINFSK